MVAAWVFINYILTRDSVKGILGPRNSIKTYVSVVCVRIFTSIFKYLLDCHKLQHTRARSI